MNPIEQYIISLFNFLLLIVFIYLVMRWPIRTLLRGRKNKIRTSIQDSLTRNKEAYDQYIIAKNKRAKADEDASNLRKSLVESSSYAYDSIINKAHETSQRIKKETEIQTDNEKKVATENIIKETITNAFSRAEKILSDKSDKKNQVLLLENSFKKLEQIDLKQSS